MPIVLSVATTGWVGTVSAARGDRPKRARRYPPLAIVHHDERGMASSMSFIVEPCAGEPLSTFEERDRSATYVPWTHGCAVMIVDNGCDWPLLFCGPCGERWQAEAARQARLRRLPPIYREYLAAHGITDWEPAP